MVGEGRVIGEDRVGGVGVSADTKGRTAMLDPFPIRPRLWAPSRVW
jgi:hypothetical protein